MVHEPCLSHAHDHPALHPAAGCSAHQGKRARDRGAPPRHAASPLRDLPGQGMVQQLPRSGRCHAVAPLLRKRHHRHTDNRLRAALFVGTLLYLFAATELGIFLATIAKNLPQVGLLSMPVIVPLAMLAGGTTPLEAMPMFLQKIMVFFPDRALPRIHDRCPSPGCRHRRYMASACRHGSHRHSPLHGSTHALPRHIPVSLRRMTRSGSYCASAFLADTSQLLTLLAHTATG